MKRTLIATTVLLLSLPAYAEDTWTGADKPKHLVAGAAVGAFATGIAASRTDLATAKWVGLGAGCAVGVGKELIDPTFSNRDAIITCAGAALGAWGAGWVIERQGRQTVVAYRWEF